MADACCFFASLCFFLFVVFVLCLWHGYRCLWTVCFQDTIKMEEANILNASNFLSNSHCTCMYMYRYMIHDTVPYVYQGVSVSGGGEGGGGVGPCVGLRLHTKIIKWYLVLYLEKQGRRTRSEDTIWYESSEKHLCQRQKKYLMRCKWSSSTLKSKILSYTVLVRSYQKQIFFQSEYSLSQEQNQIFFLSLSLSTSLSHHSLIFLFLFSRDATIFFFF